MKKRRSIIVGGWAALFWLITQTEWVIWMTFDKMTMTTNDCFPSPIANIRDDELPLLLTSWSTFRRKLSIFIDIVAWKRIWPETSLLTWLCSRKATWELGAHHQLPNGRRRQNNESFGSLGWIFDTYTHEYPWTCSLTTSLSPEQWVSNADCRRRRNAYREGQRQLIVDICTKDYNNRSHKYFWRELINSTTEVTYSNHCLEFTKIRYHIHLQLLCQQWRSPHFPLLLSSWCG